MPSTESTIRVNNLPTMNVTVKLSRGALLRLELAVFFIRLATWVMGNGSKVVVERADDVDE